MKKLFHRRKHDEPEVTPNGHESPYSGGNEPGLRTSLYGSTTAGGLPQIGDYPKKGNDTANVLRKKPSRRSSIRSWRSSSGSQQAVPYDRSPTPDQYGGYGMPVPLQNNNMMGAETYAPQPAAGNKRWSRTNLPQDFSNMNLGNEAPTLMTTTTTTTTTSPFITTQISYGSSGPRMPPQAQVQGKRQDYANSNASGIRAVNPSDVQGAYVSNQSQSKSRYAAAPSEASRLNNNHNNNNHHPTLKSPADAPRAGYVTNGHGNQARTKESDGIPLSKSSLIPRKEVGAGSTNSSNAYPASPYTQEGPIRGVSADKSLLAAPAKPSKGYTSRRAEPVPAPAASSIVDRNRPFSRDQHGFDAQTVVDKAKTNSKDTTVIEKVAPAVVHETVHKDVHHIREELITREIHTHDVYHRMLPVVDVEVLPARHFLPVEGGGLVEISADEVPGRGSNWVLAETVSKIPSDQAAPRGATDFTARTFPGREGDAVQYTAPEGHEKTEQTWVHPPELETGARDTGQSWPMTFDEEAPERGTYGYKSPKSSMKRSSRRPSGVSSGVARE